jgi:hypothetical protein
MAAKFMTRPIVFQLLKRGEGGTLLYIRVNTIPILFNMTPPSYKAKAITRKFLKFRNEKLFE